VLECDPYMAYIWYRVGMQALVQAVQAEECSIYRRENPGGPAGAETCSRESSSERKKSSEKVQESVQASRSRNPRTQRNPERQYIEIYRGLEKRERESREQQNGEIQQRGRKSEKRSTHPVERKRENLEEVRREREREVQSVEPRNGEERRGSAAGRQAAGMATQ